jgi:RHS repeat-associated protein
LSSTTNDLTATFAYNPAGQITSTIRTGDAYAWTGHHNEDVTGIPNGLNQLTSVGPKTLTHDTNGNVTAFGTKSFDYSSENLLLTGPNSTTLTYDPLARLDQTNSGASTSRFAYDGLDMIAEYNTSNALQRRWVFDLVSGQPIVSYEGTGTAAADRRYLSSDERGSIISVSDSTGGSIGINTYDEYGQRGTANVGMFGYTGQAWLPSMGVWYYKARVYEPELGRFLQPDPIGYPGGMNLYAYVGNDPINWLDPLGLCPLGEKDVSDPVHMDDGDIVVTGPKCIRIPSDSGVGSNLGIVTVIGNRAHRPTPQKAEAKPAYCSSLGYAVGDSLNIGGEAFQQIGILFSVFGIPEAGGVFYGVGTAAKFGADGAKYLGGGPSPIPTLAGAAVQAGVNASPLGDYIIDKVSAGIIGSVRPDPCR